MPEEWNGELTFEAVAPNNRDNVTVPPGYEYDVMIGWGDRVLPHAPKFDALDQSPEAQAAQFGYNCDYIAVLTLPGRSDRALLVVNHEFTDEELMFPSGRYSDETAKRIAMQAHGMSIVEITRLEGEGRWRTVPPEDARLNRRISATTLTQLTGPAAGVERLTTTQDPSGRDVLGTLHNCSGGYTPWGTVLTAEENFDHYFDAPDGSDPRYAQSYERYDISDHGRGWSEVDSRFDLAVEPHEPFRFGWVLEVDPFDPDSRPLKRTMLGRLKHEGATVAASGDGHVVVYMGDDERGEYAYKFVSRLAARNGDDAAARRHNMRLLDEGTLFVAAFTEEGAEDDEHDGTGTWIPLTSDQESNVAGMSVADVLIDTRLAADSVGATRMDRPEDFERNPVTGRVYCSMTNNRERGSTWPTDKVNPVSSSLVRSKLRAPLTHAKGNRHGYVLELSEHAGDASATSFAWTLFLVCGDPEAPDTYFAGYPKDRVSPISCPDNVTFDRAGNLWFCTDGNALGSNDGLFAVPTEGPHRGRVRQFLTVPVGAEACGPFISSDGLAVFTSVQHPGETEGATFEHPSSTWPHTDRFPRPSVICTVRSDGRAVGT
jgi:secreted PhoX family phosphatase